MPRQSQKSLCCNVLCAVLGLAVAATAVGTQEAPPALDLPAAAEILDGYVEATGGKKAYEKLRTRVARGMLKIDQAGVEGKIETWQQAPNLLLTATDLGDVGKTQRGSDGTHAWEITPAGPLAELLGEDARPQARLVEGDEKAHLLAEATFNADLRWRELVEKAETVGEALVAEQPAWKVKLTGKDGATRTHYYDKYTKLLVRVDASVKTLLGEVPVEVYPSDYRKTRTGIIVPHKSTQKMMSVTQTVTFESIEFNVPIDKVKFQPPAEVRKLLDEQKKPKPAKERNTPRK